MIENPDSVEYLAYFNAKIRAAIGAKEFGGGRCFFLLALILVVGKLFRQGSVAVFKFNNLCNLCLATGYGTPVFLHL